tara:strand:+ start:244 stop:753 length:510 start_codon:yes stop_codon:yes gene_type:complete
MSSGLVQIASKTITSNTASFYFTGLTEDCPYLLNFQGVQMENQNEDIYIRGGNSGTEDTTAQYQYGVVSYYSPGNINNGATGQTGWIINFVNIHANGNGFNGWAILYDWYPATSRPGMLHASANLYTGGAGIYGSRGGSQFFNDISWSEVHIGFGGNIASGEIGLYKYV